MPLYLLAWAAMPGDSSARGLGRSRRSAVEVALGVGLLAISAMLALRGMGLWISDAVTWPLALVAGGVALLWRGGIGARPPAPAERTPVAAVPAPVEPAARVANVSRQGLGAALLVAAGLVFLQATGSLSAARDVILAALVVAVGPRAHLRAVDRCAWPARSPPSAPSASARRSARRSPRTCTTRSCRRSRSCSGAPTTRARSPRSPARQERELRAWLAGRAPAGAATAPGRGAGGGRRRGRGAPRRPDRGRRRRRRRRSTPPARRSSPPRARRWSTRRSSRGGAPIAVYAEVDRRRAAGLRARSRPGLRPRRRPRRSPRRAESIVGRMAAPRRARDGDAAPGRGHGGRAELDRSAMSDTARRAGRRPRAVPLRRARRARGARRHRRRRRRPSTRRSS